MGHSASRRRCRPSRIDRVGCARGGSLISLEQVSGNLIDEWLADREPADLVAGKLECADGRNDSARYVAPPDGSFAGLVTRLVLVRVGADEPSAFRGRVRFAGFEPSAVAVPARISCSIGAGSGASAGAGAAGRGRNQAGTNSAGLTRTW
jgi:hypothetical protein